MATYLYRLGGWAFVHRRTVVGAWALVLVAFAAAAVAFKGPTNDQFSVPGTQSQEAQDLLHEKFPGAGGASARVVFVAPAGEQLTDAENRTAVTATMARAAKAPQVAAIIDPYSANALTRDRRVGYADVIYPVPAHEVEQDARDALERTADPAKAAGLQVEWGGGLVTDTEEKNSEGIGMMIAFVVLAIALASLLAAVLPLLVAIVSVAVGMLGITALSGVVDVSEVAPILATMLGLAVGIDYTLFILSRFKQNLAEGFEPREAAAQATGTAGSAVVFAGLTVVIALAGLAVLGIPFVTVMGFAAAATVTTAVLVAITLLPAILGFTGGKLGRTNRLLTFRFRKRAEGRPSASTRWAAFVTRRPIPVLLAGLVMLLAIAIPATHLKLGLPDASAKPTDVTERRAYDLLTDGFGPGFNGPLTVVVDAPGLSAENQKLVAEAATHDLAAIPGVAAVSPAAQNEAGDVTIVSVTPSSGPSTDETSDLVSLIRDKAEQVEADTGINVMVTGQTALNIDTAERIRSALPIYAVVVVGLALALLTLVFRSILVPIKAAAGFLLTIAASLGLVVWIFQDGHLGGLFGVDNPAPIVCFLPVLLIGILFGLAMDYEVFLISRVRESFVHSGKPREAIVTGYGQSGRVVVAAALIMIAVFASFVLSTDPIVKSIGLSLAFGVMVDAFVVRLTLVPAVMALLDRKAWWLPRRIDRRMPDIDIEGEKLLTNLKQAPARS